MFMLALTRRNPVQRPGLTVAHAESDASPSFLGPRTGIAGIVEIEGALVISGRVKGQIAARRLVIAAGGYVEGDIVAQEVVITGRLNGRVFAPIVSIEDGAEVEGRIFHTTITVARGAHVTGRMPWRPLSYFETLDKLPENRP
jgi:cytoskeletal protein CcmA (bactofilin family)